MKKEMKSWLKKSKNQSAAMDIYDVLPSKLQRTKCLKRAESLRRAGNRIFTSCSSMQDFQNLYSYYSKSIAYAPAKSTELALAYSNLSAVLIRLEKHTECLQAIDCCLSMGYPEESKFKIYLRKIECLKVLDEPLKAKEAYKETLAWVKKNHTYEGQRCEMKTRLDDCYKKQVEIKKSFAEDEVDQIWKKFAIKSFSKEIPGVSNALGLRYTESLGRHFVAERDIRPGEMLIKDRPYSLVCSENCRYQCCWECLKTLTNCVPCEFCENVVFCSVKCKEEAWKTYHNVECELLPLFLNSGTGTVFINQLIIALRVLVLAIREYGSIQKLRKAAKKMEQSSKDPRTKGFINGQLLGDKYMAFINLKSRCDFGSESGIASEVATAVVYHIATTTTLLGEKIEPDWGELYKNKDFVFATCTFVRHLYILKTNQISVFKNFPWTGNTAMLSLSIPASLINHSCVPNVLVIPAKSCTKALALLPIKKGEQIFVNYLGDDDHDKEARQTYLQATYNFTCACIACTNDWPSPKKYPNVEELPEEYGPVLSSTYLTAAQYIAAVKTLEVKHGQNIRKNHKFLIAILKHLSESIEKLNANVPQPCADLKLLQDTMILFFMKLHSSFM